ncbi:class I adenylate-forming enzyme family protein [Rhodococcus sp. IEGM 1408]|uniref:class I adenylate-forming enzyme family protein n=1 Tax=Rhodococcus sp. IEGM 1408 TaxID=3082220 RepID=UPI002953E23C|nr:AMP-binding protein [Rhodococcus sp. IEGM 1408]MDV8002621.1 AMP-binding protein [Rhodococcus sp. IEGM 1408]
MSELDSRPWRELYRPGLDESLAGQPATLVDAWRERVAANPDRTAIAYFDTALTALEVDRLSDALGAALQDRGVGAGDRVGIHLQNIPQYALGMLALWKIGAAAVVLNPMYFGRELRLPVEDSGAVGIIATDTDVPAIRDSVAGTDTAWILSTSERDLQTRDDPRAFAGDEPNDVSEDGDLLALMREYDGRSPEPVTATPGDLALLTYTSGTTGPPKGAMNSHANVVAVARSFADFVGVVPGDVVLAIAPLFHITGAVINATLALLADTTLVFAGRFRPGVVLDAFREHGVTYTIGSITAYNALMRLDEAGPEHFAAVKTLYSGGAPIPPSTVDRFQERFGHYIHNGYGMTETTSGVVAVPPGLRAPVDETSGTLSIGVPLPGIDASVVGADDRPVAAGEQGELVLSGPQIVSGYWRNEVATAGAMPGGRLHTGDVAVIDEAGWVYLVDRLKDQINASGYKVWPREVEDALYEHDAVFEAAVVGLPDAYRGEKVVAFVSLKAGLTATEDELVAFAATRLAAYKRPTEVHVVRELPKTQTGKIRRRELRDEHTPAQTS